MDACVCGLQRRSALPCLVRETWSVTTGSEHEVANDQIWAHSGKYLRNYQLQCKKGRESCVRILAVVLWCRFELNIGDAWCCYRYSLLLPAKTKTDPQPRPRKHGEEGRRALTVYRCKSFQFISSTHRGLTRRDLHLGKLETTDKVRRGSLMVLARNPLHKCSRTVLGRENGQMRSSGGQSRGSEISQMVTPFKCLCKSDIEPFLYPGARLIATHRRIGYVRTV